MENTKSGGIMEEEILLKHDISKKDGMEQKLNSNMKTNDSERMQPKGCGKLTLKQFSEYYDPERTKLCYQYHEDQNNKRQSEGIWWYLNGQIAQIGNYKDGRFHGKFQYWWNDGRIWYIDTRHLKKGRHGTEIEFKYGK